jgi:hypothetical protein
MEKDKSDPHVQKGQTNTKQLSRKRPTEHVLKKYNKFLKQQFKEKNLKGL